MTPKKTGSLVAAFVKGFPRFIPSFPAEHQQVDADVDGATNVSHRDQACPV